MSAYNEVKRESKPVLQTPGIPHLQSHMSAPILTENPGGASQTHGISEISYLNVNYQGPLAWEVQRARANRQNFQNTLQTIMATNAKLKNIFIIDDCQFFINEVMMYLLVDNGTVGFKKLQEQVGKLGQLTSYEFNEFVNCVVTVLVNFGLADALVQKMLEALNEVQGVFVEIRENCVCFLFGSGKICGECENSVYYKERLIKD